MTAQVTGADATSTAPALMPDGVRGPPSSTVAAGWALFGALALAAAFPPWGLWFLAPAGPAGLLLAVRGRRPRAAFGLGALFGLVFFGALLTWLINLGVAAWLLLTLTQAVATGLLGVALALAWRLPGRALALPCIWVGGEALRARFPFGGFPWGRLGFSQADSPLASWVSVGGVPLLSYVLAVVGTTAVLAVLHVAASRTRRAALVGVTLALAVVGALMAPTLTISGGSRNEPAQTATIAVVQGNVPRSLAVVGRTRIDQVVANHVEATRLLAARVRAGTTPAPDLVIWPESSVDIDPTRRPQVRAMIVEALAAIDRPILIGAILDAPDGRARNVGQLWVPGQGPGASYDKRHLVPFGEYIPFRSVLGGRGDLALIPRDFRPGDGPAIITSGAIRIGDVICYEVAFDDSSRDAVRAGANLLVAQSNNASYLRDGQQGETLQQLAMSRLRAIEHDRPVAVATTSGISALVRRDGTVQARTGIWRAQTLVGEVELRTSRTLATRLGAWPETVLGLLALVIPALGLVRRQPRGRLSR